MTTAPRRRTGRPGIAWAVPGLLFFLFFAAAPMLIVGYLSFTQWDGLSNPSWTGTDNWDRLWNDDTMRQAIALSLLLTVLTWLFQTPIALLLGVWAAGRQRTRALLSAIFFLPLLASSVALALLWKTIFDPNLGLNAQIADWLNLSSADLLGSPRGAFAAVLFVTAWQFIPLHTLLYQGGARQIPQSLYDAAALDGAGTVRQFFAITLPQLRNTIVTSSVLMVVGALTYFDTVLILTRGGPGDATTIVPFLMYRTGFQAFDLGYASAVATALVITATAVSLLLVRLTGFSKMRSTREGI
ncbi:sugar ABC transporter permease [Streptomyces carpaticus]|uniref:Xylobiose transport system permease protein n=1 Tax=Streptomyces harbinensis TaxID=1176198 RepID=A0A1I6RFZ6_9ACTN|nr:MULTISPECIES: sugar ABC transporter permease [Streptomyces]MCK1814684.1 sugar ABC transporter permease [Streptomyces sp. XM4011]UWM49047.1 sugar ABC transporter permease [Streptomyces carpaticus]SFS63653.1 xylobiose transport system permease protein [Streptomyces harbinensis]